MRIVVTEAASPLAYHVTSLVASGEVFPGQPVDLTLCDHSENLDRVNGLAYELQDCVHPLLKDISVTSDFLSSFKTADVVLVLPHQSQRARGPAQVHMDYSLLSQINFNGLDGVFHHRGIDKQEQVSVSALGTMSSAVKITSCLTDLYLSAENQAFESRLQAAVSWAEEAEFGVPPVCEDWSVTPTGSGVDSWSGENRLLMMLVSITDSNKQNMDTSTTNVNIKFHTMSRL